MTSQDLMHQIGSSRETWRNFLRWFQFRSVNTVARAIGVAASTNMAFETSGPWKITAVLMMFLVTALPTRVGSGLGLLGQSRDVFSITSSKGNVSGEIIVTETVVSSPNGSLVSHLVSPGHLCCLFTSTNTGGVFDEKTWFHSARSWKTCHLRRQEHPKFIVDSALLSGSAVASQCPWWHVAWPVG